MIALLADKAMSWIVYPTTTRSALAISYLRIVEASAFKVNHRVLPSPQRTKLLTSSLKSLYATVEVEL
jgi:hypothetical protein